MQLRLLLLVVSVLAGVVRAGEPADLVLTGGMMRTMDASVPTAEALAVRDGRIVWIGRSADAAAFRGAGTHWIDLSGAAVFPGFIDAHGHVRNLGRYMTNLQLVGTRSRKEVSERVRDRQASTPPGRWIRGRGWDQNDWQTKTFPTADDLAGTEANPVYLRRVDGHACWVNRTALEVCGISRDTPDPPGGRILRDADGVPTGVLVDAAEDLVKERIPPPTAAELDEWMRLSVQACNSVGLVAVHDAGTTAAHLASLRRLHRSGDLTLRVYCMVDSDDEAFVAERLAAGPSEFADGLISVHAMKIYVDGALGSRGAALIEPYDDESGNVGLLQHSQSALQSWVDACVDAGFQPCAHAIGDRGNRIILDVYEAALAARPAADHRFRVEHAQVISMADIERFGELGVIPSMQPTHATSDMYWAEDRIGPERIVGAYAWRTLVESGNRLPLGSDFPVESHNPLWGIYAAVTRQDHDGWPEGGWYPSQRLSVAEAIRGFTLDAAYAEFAEGERGSLTVGKRADITVLDRDITVTPASEILHAQVRYTIVDGRIVYQSGE